jgi:hypothetical protein
MLQEWEDILERHIVLSLIWKDHPILPFAVSQAQAHPEHPPLHMTFLQYPYPTQHTQETFIHPRPSDTVDNGPFTQTPTPLVRFNLSALNHVSILDNRIHRTNPLN